MTTIRTLTCALFALGVLASVDTDAQVVCCKRPVPPPVTEPRPEAMRLFDAVRDGTVASVKALLDSGASPNVKDSYGWTPLMAAVQKRDVEAVKLMLLHGADVTATEKHGLTPAALATMSRNPQLIQVIEMRGGR